MKRVFLILLTLALVGSITCDSNPCESAEENAHLPIPGDCEKFIICGCYQVVATASCLYGTYFDGNLGYCTNVAPPGCGGSTLPPTTAPPCTKPTTTVKTTTAKPTTTPKTTTPKTTTTAKPVTTPKTTTPAKPATTPKTTTPKATTPLPTTGPPSDAGPCSSCNKEYLGKLVPVVGDCTKYCVCQFYDHQELNKIMPCPPGLHFNPNLQVCDWPLAAGCEYAE